MARRSRILFVSTQMEAGGVQRVATTMLESLLDEGVEASLVFLYTKRPVFEGRRGIVSLMPSRPRGLFGNLTVVFRLVEHIRLFRPTAIVGFAHYSSPLAAIAGVLCGVPVRIANQTNPPKSHGVLARVLDWTCGTLGIYTANVAVSKSVESMFAGYPASYRSQLLTIHNGTNVRTPTISRAEARAVFELPDRFTMVTCGRLSPQKNQRFLLPLVAGIPEVHLAILGEGPERSNLEQEVARLGLGSRVSLLGEVKPEMVPNFLQCGDVFVLPSRFEGLPVALIEAMAAGLPAIGSDHPSIAETLGEAGLAISLEDSERWATEIEHLRVDPERRNQASQRSRVRAQDFSFDKMLERFRDLWGADASV